MQMINLGLATDTLAYISVIESMTVNRCPVLLAEGRYVRCNTSAITIANLCTKIVPTCVTTTAAQRNSTSESVRIRSRATFICSRNRKCRKCKGREYELSDEHGKFGWVWLWLLRKMLWWK